jgi:hypothetical protein
MYHLNVGLSPLHPAPERRRWVVDLTEIARLMEANLLQVFNERDPARRREVIARTYTADVRWTDDDDTTVGHDALNTKAQQLQDGPLTGLVFVTKGAVYARPASASWPLT